MTSSSGQDKPRPYDDMTWADAALGGPRSTAGSLLIYWHYFYTLTLLNFYTLAYALLHPNPYLK